MDTFIYKIAKNCEHPINIFWKCMQIPFAFFMRLYGKKTIAVIRKNATEKDFVFLASKDIGDVLFFRSSLQQCLDINKLKFEDIVFVGNNMTCKVAQMVGINNVYAISQPALSAISMEYHCNYWQYEDFHFCYPWCFFDYENTTDCYKPEKKVFFCDKEKVYNNMIEAGYVQNASVILSPYQNAFEAEGEKDIPFEFWEKLAMELKKKGFVVCTNCSGKGKEIPIKGTEIFFPKINECQTSVDFTGYSVSIRSGFVDFVKDTTGKLIVIYPSNSYKDMWSINKTTKKGNIIEFVYSQGNDIQHMIDLIMEKLNSTI